MTVTYLKRASRTAETGTGDTRATVAALHGHAFGGLEWVVERRFAEGAAAFADLDAGRSGAAKILLRPD